MVLIYNLADTFFIGQTHDDLQVAAVSLATPVFLLFMSVGTVFGIGGTSVISRALDEGWRDYAKKVCSFCMWCCVAIGVLMSALFLIFMDQILAMIGASAETWDYAKTYLTIVSCSGPFVLIANCYSNVIRAEGQSGKAMMGQLLGNLLNVILDPIMILVFGWNIAGAAIATVIGNLLSAVFYVSHLLSKKSQLSIRLQDYKAGDKIAGSVFAIGIPASLNSVLMSVSNIFINNLMAHYGDMAVAGLGVAMKVNMIVVMLLIGLGTGIQPLLGYCFGAGNRKRYFAVLKFSILLAFILSAIMTCVCYFGADGLVSAFLEDADAYDFGFQFSRIYILSGPILGQLFVFINAIQSTGAALPSLILSISRQGLLYLPILFIINATTDSARLLALAQPVTDYLATALAIILFVITCKKYFPKKSSIE